MPSSDKSNLEQQNISLQEEIRLLKIKNTDLNEQVKAYASINSGQVSLINKLIDKVPFGVILLSEKRLVTHANQAAEKIFSLPAAKIKGMSRHELFLESEYIHDDSSGKKVTRLNNDKYVMHSDFISEEGSQSVTVESFIDISEIKHAEQELITVNKTKDEFLGMISHELRSPLNVIHGYSSLLEEEIKEMENTTALSYMENIRHAGEKLLHVVSNLLELSNLTAGNVNVDTIPVDLNVIITQLQYRLEKEISREGNTLVFKHGEIPAFEQDLALLLKILYELLVNANKFTEKGEIIVSVSIEDKENKKWLQFEISDNGCGMTDETSQQVFEAFRQADSSLTRAHEGLGLGLSMVEKMVKILKGSINVKSQLGVGTTFIVLLPYIQVE